MTDTEAAVAADVGKFLANYIDTVPHLEGLLLLWNSASRYWTEAEIAARIYVAPEFARRIVVDLERHQFITRASDGAALFTFNAQCDAAPLLPTLARAYRDHLVPVTRLIHSKPALKP